MHKKIICLLVSGALILAPIYSTYAIENNISNNSIYATEKTQAVDKSKPIQKIIYEKKTEEIVTSGLIRENIKRFTQEGWLNINVIRIDMDNPNIKLDSLMNDQSLLNLTTTLDIVNQKGAVAGVNGSFFSWLETKGQGEPVGTIVEAGEVKTTNSWLNKNEITTATFAIDNSNTPSIDIWKTKINLSNSKGVNLDVARYNGSYIGYSSLFIWDNKYSKESHGVTNKYPDIFEMVVENDIVVEFRENKEKTIIPENGYVVITEKSGAELLKKSFKPGDKIIKSITTSLDLEKIEMAISGSSVLIKDGVIPDTFINEISGRHPRTAIGFTKDKKKIIIVTVDGRQDVSIGMTQKELAELLLELGVFNAMNLDGGGSTTFVARPLGENRATILNSPSDRYPRKVSSSVGVFSLAEPAPLEQIIISSEHDNVFVNTTRAFTVKGYDKNYNPVAIDLNEVEFTISGIEGYFEGNILYPQTVGEGIVTAKYNGKIAKINISSLSSPVRLELSVKNIKLDINNSKQIMVVGANRFGYTAPINSRDLNYELTSNIGEVTDGIFYAKKIGVGYLNISVNDTYAYCSISVGSSVDYKIDDFEKGAYTFTSYPNYVTGNFGLTKEQKFSGELSGKLSYNFTNSNETQAAYLVFADKGVKLSPNAKKLSLQVYSTHYSPILLKAKIIDEKGESHLVDLAKELNWIGWSEVVLNCNSLGFKPAYLERIYVVKTQPVEAKGAIYLDNLSFTVSEYPNIDIKSIPQDTKPFDEAEKTVNYQAGANNFRFSVLGQASDLQNEDEVQLIKKYVDKNNKYIDVATVVGRGNKGINQQFTKPLLSTEKKYSFLDIASSRLINLNTDGGGLRVADKEQWSWLFNQLDSFNGENVFLFISQKPDNLSNPYEAALLKETLTEYKKKKYKNIWVFYNGSENSSYMERGVKYISSAGLAAVKDKKDTKTYIKEAQFVLVTVVNGVPTFQIKTVW